MKIVYVGDIGVDDYEGKLYPGGCGLNVSYYANLSGLKIDLVSCIGNDKYGKIPLDIAKKNKLNISYIHSLNGDTPRQLIKVLPSGEKKFIAYNPGVLSDFKLSQKDKEFILSHKILITIYYSQINHLFQEVTGINFSGTKIIDFMDGKDFNKDINFVNKISQLFRKLFQIKPNIFHDKGRNSYYCHFKSIIFFTWLYSPEVML